MVRNYKKKSSRGQVQPEVIKAAVLAVKGGRSLRGAAADFGLNFKTLANYCKKMNPVLESMTVITPVEAAETAGVPAEAAGAAPQLAPVVGAVRFGYAKPWAVSKPMLLIICSYRNL